MPFEINPKLLDVVQFEDSSARGGETPQGTIVDVLGGAPETVLVEVSNNQGIPQAFVARPAGELRRVWEAIKSAPIESPIPEAQQYFENGILFIQNGLVARAREQFSKSFSADPKFRGGLLNTTNVLAARGAFDAAVLLYTMILELSPEYDLARENLSITHMNRGIALARSGLIPQAIEEFNRALMLKPSAKTIEAIRRNIVAAYTQLGILYSNVKQYQLAFQCFQWALELDPSEISRKNLAVAMVALSTVKTEKRTSEATAEIFRQPLLMGLTLSECLTAYGATLAGLGEIAQAKHTFRLALNADPGNQIAERNLEVISARQSDEDIVAGLVPLEIEPPQVLRS